MPFKIIPDLKKTFPKINFVHHDPNENLPEDGQEIIIIDTVINTKKVITITEPDQISTDSVYSPHDWDLALNLKLLIKLGKIKKFLIIGLPPTGNTDQIYQAVVKIIKDKV